VAVPLAVISPATVKVDAISTAPSISTASKLVVPSTSKSPLKSTLPATASVVAMSTAPSMSTASRLVVPSTSMSPDMSNSVAMTLSLNVAAPAADISSVKASIEDPPSLPLKIMSASLVFE